MLRQKSSEEQKKVFTSTNVQFPSQNQVKTKKKGLHVRRRPIFRVKSGDDQKRQGWQSHRRASAIFVTAVKLRCAVRCDTSLKLRMRFLLRLSKFFRRDFLCWHLRLFVRFSIISIFRVILNSHILQIVTLEQKLRKSFLVKLSF